MKKTLVALAAVVATGAAFAQSSVTLGGMYNFGLQKVDSGASSADFFDAKINFSGVEDLGSGMKAAFSTEIQVGGRQNLEPTTLSTKSGGVWARNALLSLSGEFGTVRGGRIESSNVHESAKIAGASLGDGFDKAGLAGAVSNFNTIGYTSPAFSGFSVGIAQLKSLNNDFAPKTGVENKENTVNVLSGSYANGPLAAGFAFKAAELYSAALVKKVTGTKMEGFATYDLGVAKLGLGVGSNDGDAYKDEKPTMIVSALVPLASNFTLGADYATRAAGGASTTNTTTKVSKDGTGYAIAANYMLSKRTKINATLGKIEGNGITGEDQYRVGLFHSF